MSPDFLLHLATIIAGSAGVYAAIRSDLTLAMAKAEQASKDADKALARIDSHIEKHN